MGLEKDKSLEALGAMGWRLASGSGAPVIERTLESMLDCWDWYSVFGIHTNGGNTGQLGIESYDGTPCQGFDYQDIAECIASVDGYEDGPDWLGVFRLHDGRWLAASGGCDYTGWD